MLSPQFPLPGRVLLLPPAHLAWHSVGVGCAVGSVRCREVHPVGILAKGISAGKQKAPAGKQGVTFWTGECDSLV